MTCYFHFSCLVRNCLVRHILIRSSEHKERRDYAFRRIADYFSIVIPFCIRNANRSIAKLGAASSSGQPFHLHCRGLSMLNHQRIRLAKNRIRLSCHTHRWRAKLRLQHLIVQTKNFLV